MKTLLTGAVFNNQTIDNRQAQDLIKQAQDLMNQIHALATAP